MKALVFHGPGKRSWEGKPRPSIDKPTDAVVRITHTTICGFDLRLQAPWVKNIFLRTGW